MLISFLIPEYLNVNCGPPKEIIGSVKSYNSTMYKSEVSYICPDGEKLKSMCEKNNEWTPIVSSCKGNIKCLLF